MPEPVLEHPLAPALLLRTLRLSCLTRAYEPLWSELFDQPWMQEQKWALNWPRSTPLSEVTAEWTWDVPLRTENERRAALVEIDALVAVWLGMGIEELLAIYRSRYPILADREAELYFDANGRRIAADSYAFGYGQTKEDWVQFEAHLKDPDNVPPPDGYTAPFYKADREAEMRQAHVVFSQQLTRAKQASSS